jgi:hypothetical protein
MFKRIGFVNKLDNFCVTFLYVAVLPLLPIILMAAISIIIPKNLPILFKYGSISIFILYEAWYFFFIRIILKNLVKSKNKCPHKITAKIVIWGYVILIVPIMLHFILMVAVMPFLLLPDITQGTALLAICSFLFIFIYLIKYLTKSLEIINEK